VTDDQPFPSLISTASGVGIVIWDKVIIEGLSVGIVFYLNHVMYLECESLNVKSKVWLIEYAIIILFYLSRFKSNLPYRKYRHDRHFIIHFEHYKKELCYRNQICIESLKVFVKNCIQVNYTAI